MMKVKVVDRPEVMGKDVYVYYRLDDGTTALLVPFEDGYTYDYFERGTAFPEYQKPTLRIGIHWEQQLVEALSPAVPKVEQFVYDTINYERSIIDRLLKNE
jgi:hypothetical protein